MLIKTVKLDAYVKALEDPNGVCDLGRFTMVEHSQFDELQLGENAAAIGGDVIDHILFKNERILLRSVIVSISTMLQLEGENELNFLINVFNQKATERLHDFESSEKYQDILLGIERRINESYARVKSGAADVNNPDDKLLLEKFQNVQSRIDSGEYIVGALERNMDLASIVKRLAYIKLYQKEIGAELHTLAQSVITEEFGNKYIDDLGNVVAVEPLSLHSGADRHTFVIAGAPACGKGSLEKKVANHAASLDIDFNDIVKVNTDNYRGALSAASELGPDKTLHAQLNNDEAKLITKMVRKEYEKQLRGGKAPHLFLDLVDPTEEKIALGIQDNGQTHIKVVTVDPILSVQRSVERGKATGRFVPMAYILESHRNMGEALTDLVINNVGKNIDYEIYDNEVSFGSEPVLIEGGDLRENRIHVDDLQRDAKFRGRKFINTEAETTQDIWGAKQNLEDRSFLNVYKKCGFEVVSTQSKHKEVLPIVGSEIQVYQGSTTTALTPMPFGTYYGLQLERLGAGGVLSTTPNSLYELIPTINTFLYICSGIYQKPTIDFTPRIIVMDKEIAAYPWLATSEVSDFVGESDVSWKIEQISDMKEKNRQNAALTKYQGGNTVVHLAALEGNSGAIKRIITTNGIDKFALLKKPNDVGETALHIAVWHDNLEMTQVMLDSMSFAERARILEIRNNDNFTPLELAIQSNNFEMVVNILECVEAKELKYLLANVNDKIYKYLAEHDDYKEMSELLGSYRKKYPEPSYFNQVCDVASTNLASLLSCAKPSAFSWLIDHKSQKLTSSSEIQGDVEHRTEFIESGVSDMDNALRSNEGKDNTQTSLDGKAHEK